MAEYLVQDTSLTSVADKIRVLSGTTGTMSLDTMKTHIEDANNEVNIQTDLLAQVTTALEGDASGSYLAPIVDALTDKGIEVPSGMNVDGLAALIAAIESGSGEGALVFETDITPANDVIGDVINNSTYIQISHNLGKIPHTAIIFRNQNVGTVRYETYLTIETSLERAGNYNLFFCIFHNSSTAQANEYNLSSLAVSGKTTSFNSNEQFSYLARNVTENSLDLYGQYSYSTPRLKAGSTYHLVVIA